MNASSSRPVRLRLDLLPAADLGPDEVAVVVDVLRMTTTATVLGELGLERLSVVADVERARRRARAEGALLIGERHARPLPGFDGGNSPLEYTAESVRGRRAVLCTTNGSAAVEACAGAAGVLLGSLRNATAVATRALDHGAGTVRVVCAGTEGAVSLDDVAAAGVIVGALLQRAPAADLDDAALLALAVAGSGSPIALLERSRHGRTLTDAGFEADLEAAARTDVTGAVMERLADAPDTFAPTPPVD